MMVFFFKKKKINERAMMLLHYLYKSNCIYRHLGGKGVIFFFLIFKVGYWHSIKHAINTSK